MKKDFPQFRKNLMQLMLVTILGASLALPHSVLAQSTKNNQSLPTLGDTARGDLSPVMERKIGEQIMSSVRQDPDFLELIRLNQQFFTTCARFIEVDRWISTFLC